MIYKFEKVLVTGGAGCIGMPVCDELLARGIKVVLFDLYEQISIVKDRIDSRISVFPGSILDKSALRQAMSGCDGVIHLAAHLGVRRTEVNSLRCLDININGTKNVLEIASNSMVKKVISASSSEVYGEPLHNPVKETDITQGKTVYAISKLAGEELVKAYSREVGTFSYTILRYFNTYGPYQIAQFVIPKFINNVMNDKSPVVYGDGRQQRSFNFSKDTARATVDSLVYKKADFEIMNIGNSDALVSLKDLASLIIKCCNKSDKIEVVIKSDFDNTDRNSEREIFKRYCSTSKAEELIGYKPQYSLEEGINEVISVGILPLEWATSEKDYTVDDSR